MPSLDIEPNTFLKYRSLLYDNLSKLGFVSKGDISIKNFDSDERAQIVVSGNNYFISLVLQIAFPSAVSEIEKNYLPKGGLKLHSQGIYNPLFSIDARDTLLTKKFDYFSSVPDWSEASKSIGMLVDNIREIYDSYITEGICDGSPWWPPYLSEIQKQILSVILNKGGLEGARLASLRNCIDR